VTSDTQNSIAIGTKGASYFIEQSNFF
jgi:hypothetical protein